MGKQSLTEQEQQQIFTEWLTQHRGIFFKIVRAYAFNPADQDDLFQEIGIQVWKSIPDFRGDAKPSTWIYRVALYTAIAWLRREKKEPELQPLVQVEQTLVFNEEARDERLEWLYAQIQQLEPVDRSICLLMLEGYSYKEIAELVGSSASNVGGKLHRIKQRLLREAKQLSPKTAVSNNKN